MNRHFIYFWTKEIMPVLVAGIIGGFMVSVIFGRVDQKYVDKVKLHSEIEMAINSGAELQDIKQIFENRKYVRQNILINIFRSTEEEAKAVYNEPLALSSVLKDLKADIFLHKDGRKDLALKIKTILAEHEKTNPFDKLDSGQRIHFETIQSKLGDSYGHIQQDVNLIVDELSSKNQLITKYLRDATLSFRLSVVALVIGLLAFLPQVVATWRWWRNKIEKREIKTT